MNDICSEPGDIRLDRCGYLFSLRSRLSSTRRSVSFAKSSASGRHSTANRRISFCLQRRSLCAAIKGSLSKKRSSMSPAVGGSLSSISVGSTKLAQRHSPCKRTPPNRKGFRAYSSGTSVFAPRVKQRQNAVSAIRAFPRRRVSSSRLLPHRQLSIGLPKRVARQHI